MIKSQIIDNIRDRLGIASLNPMQLAVTSAQSDNILLLSPTGSGKTIAFAIALLKKIGKPSGQVQAVVLAPSRELVIQIFEIIRPIATECKTSAFYGGHRMTEETNSISGAVPDIVIATPGRLLDHLNRNTIDLSAVRCVVFDEYDKSLELGFQDEMRKIIRRMPRRIPSVIMTSATRLAELPTFINVDTLKTIDFLERTESPKTRMQFVEVHSLERDKLNTLANLLATFGRDCKTIVFLNHRESVERTYEAMRRHGFPVGMYHGGLEQQDRELAIDLLNNGTTPILISTDLASRGLDIVSVEAVVHYHFPVTEEVYTHRNGRTARVDSTGTVYTIVADGENIPGYIRFDRRYEPKPFEGRPEESSTATLFFSGGKKEKISRGDIAGFLIQKGRLQPDEVGKIVVRDHNALVAVPRKSAGMVLNSITGEKIKGKSIRVTLLRK